MKLYGRIVFAAALTTVFAAAPAHALCVAETAVFGSASLTGQAMWAYDFSVQNGCSTNNQPFLTDFYIPYFADDAIVNLMVPPPDTTSTTSTIAWNAIIEPNNNLFNLAGAGVIDFHVTATPELQVAQNQDAPGVGYYGAAGFGFTSTFAPLAGPYAILQYLPPTYTTTRTLFGDPAIPGSPDAIAALNGNTTPEPGATALLAVGLCLMALFLRRHCKT